ncbi:hypothetical protein A2U01_0059420, partial [Trifolium medium]|nr:hypothetical protein [Trifolium medium]
MFGTSRWFSYFHGNGVSPVVECGVVRLSVSLWVLDGREVLLGVSGNEEISKFLVRELHSIVRDRGLWDPKPA